MHQSSQGLKYSLHIVSSSRMKIIIYLNVNKLYTRKHQRTIFPHSASLSGHLVMKSMTHVKLHK